MTFFFFLNIDTSLFMDVVNTGLPIYMLSITLDTDNHVFILCKQLKMQLKYFLRGLLC